MRSNLFEKWLFLQVLDEEGFEEIKIRFYNLMIEYHTSNDETWETCQSYYKVCNFPTCYTKSFFICVFFFWVAFSIN